MPYLQLLVIILVAAAIISLILSFLGILVVGALRLLPIVFIVIAIGVLMGKIKISVRRGDRDDR